MPLIPEDNAPADLQELFEAAKPELEELEFSASEARRNASRQRVLELSSIMLSSWAPMQHLFDEQLSPALAEQRKAELAGLDARAWIFYAADMAAEEPRSDTNKKARAELALRVKEHDRFLMLWAVPTFGDDPDHAATLRDISRGSGRRDDAEDVQRLVTLFKDNWEIAANKQNTVTEAKLEEAAADAAKQLDYLRKRKKNPARKLADAAYLLWYRDYDELMALGRYLTRKEADSAHRFPGVQEERGARAPLKVEEPGANEDDEDDDEDEAKKIDQNA